MNLFQTLWRVIDYRPVPFNPDPTQNPFRLFPFPPSGAVATATALSDLALQRLYATGEARPVGNPHFYNPSSPTSEAERFVADHQARLQQQIYNFEPEILNKAAAINSKRAKEGKPPIDLAGTTRRIEEITNSNLSNKEKRKRINNIRKELGLSKGEIKKLFTGRLKKIYDRAAKEVEGVRKNLQAELASIEKSYGKDSPQAAAARARIESLEKVLQPYEQKLKDNASLYKSMYKPGGCVKKVFGKIGGFFKKVGSVLKKVAKVALAIAPIVTAFIPGVGPAIAIGIAAARTAYYAAKGKFLDALTAAADMFGGIGGKVAKFGQLAVAAGRTAYYAAKGKGLQALAEGAGFLGNLSAVTKGAISTAAQWGSKIINKGLEAYDAFRSGWQGVVGWIGGQIYDWWGRRRADQPQEPQI